MSSNNIRLITVFPSRKYAQLYLEATKMTHSKDRKNIKLDDYETDLENNMEKNIRLDEKEKNKHLSSLKQAADNYVKKDKRINISVVAEI